MRIDCASCKENPAVGEKEKKLQEKYAADPIQFVRLNIPFIKGKEIHYLIFFIFFTYTKNRLKS